MKPRRPTLCQAAVASLTLAILVSSQPVEAADKDEATEKETPVVEVNPDGQPKGYDKAPDGPTYYLWRDGDVWHLRTKTKKKTHQFHGLIRIKGGTVKKIYNFSGLEAQPRKKGKKGQAAPADIGRWNDARNEIEFKFRTSGGEDGFDFQLSDKATDLSLDLKLDGYEHRGRIVVGKDAQTPPQPVFTIAIPQDQPDKKKGSAKTN